VRQRANQRLEPTALSGGLSIAATASTQGGLSTRDKLGYQGLSSPFDVSRIRSLLLINSLIVSVLTPS